MGFSELYKNIILAERDYTYLDEKLIFVNLRLRYIKIDPDTKEITTNKGCKKRLIKKNTYYREIGKYRTKARTNGYLLSKTLLSELINEHENLLADRIELREMKDKAKKDNKLMIATRLKIAQIELGRRIFAVKNNIAVLMERPRIGEEINEESIRLLTNL